MKSLPFEPKIVEAHGNDLMECGLFRSLPADAREFIKIDDNRHVLSYLHMLPLEEMGIPKFYPELTRALKDIKHPNIIYPAGGGISIHIFPDKEDARDYYIPIEPVMFHEMNERLLEIEEALVDVVDILDAAANDMEDKKVLLEMALKEICVIKDNRDESGNKLIIKFNKFFKLHKNKIYLTLEEFQAIKYIILRDKVGMGVLEPLILDPYIEDISCSGLGSLFVEHKIFSGLKTTISFEDTNELNSFVIRLSEKIGKPITYRDPIVDATLPDGSRINIVYGEDVSKQGSNFTIRKSTDTPLSILDLIEFGSLDYMIAAYLWILIKDGMNCFVAGETASGKTTLLNAMTAFIRPNAKIVSIEDTAELQVPQKNWIREITRTSREDSNSDVTMFDLLKAALRQRPDEIIIGEIRGIEGNIAFQGMQTGHPVLSTFHAASVEKLIQRLTGDPINVPKTYVDNLNLVVIQNAINSPTKGMIRRVTSINEIVGFDPSSQSFSFIETFKWDPSSDRFHFTGNLNSYLLENKIAPKHGIPHNERRKIYVELERKARMLKKLHEKGITGFHELFSMFIRLDQEEMS